MMTNYTDIFDDIVERLTVDINAMVFRILLERKETEQVFEVDTELAIESLAEQITNAIVYKK